MSESDFQDVYSDGVSVAAGPYGMTLTFLLTDPLDPSPDPKLPGRIVGRVRFSPLLAQALIRILQRSVDNMPPARLSYEDPVEDEGSVENQQ